MSKLSDSRQRRRRRKHVEKLGKTALAETSRYAETATGAARAAAERVGPYAHTALDSGKAAAERVRPYAQEAWSAAQPGLDAAKHRIAPVVDQAKARVAPAAASARDSLVTDVMPRVADTVAGAADKVADKAHLASTRAHLLSSKALAISEAQQKALKKSKRRKRGRFVLLVAGFAGVGAAVAGVLRRRKEEEQWKSYDPSAGPWSPAPKKETADAGGARPDEAKADATDGPKKPSTPDEPLTKTAVQDPAGPATPRNDIPGVGDPGEPKA